MTNTNIIAELCQNHLGDRSLLEKMVKEVASTGAKYCKIQSMRAKDLTFRERFEFGEKDPGIPRPLCLVAKELNQNKKIRLWLDEQGWADSPFKISTDVLLVAYFATAELSCFLELGWEFPEKLLDLYVEFRNLTNGLNPPLGNGLLGAMSFFGLSHIDSADKETMRALALEGGALHPKG